MEIGDFSISYRFKNVEDGFCWVFTRIYDPSVGRLRKDLWEELWTIRGLWQNLWFIGRDFNVIRFFERKKQSFKIVCNNEKILGSH